MPDALSLSDITCFRSFAHGIRIVGFCADAAQGERRSGDSVNEDNGNTAAVLPEILDVVGARLLDRWLLSGAQARKDSSVSDSPQAGKGCDLAFVRVWHNIWAVFRQIVVSIAEMESREWAEDPQVCVLSETARPEISDATAPIVAHLTCVYLSRNPVLRWQYFWIS